MSEKVESQHVEWAASDAGIDWENIREDYSGRSMYGEKCLGLVYDSPGEIAMFYRELEKVVAEEAGAEQGESLIEFMRGHEKGDAMGLHSIAYWPGLQIGTVE